MTDTLSILKEVLKNKGAHAEDRRLGHALREFNRVGGTTGYRDLFLDAESRSKSLLDELKALDRGKVSQACARRRRMAIRLQRGRWKTLPDWQPTRPRSTTG